MSPEWNDAMHQATDDAAGSAADPYACSLCRGPLTLIVVLNRRRQLSVRWCPDCDGGPA